LIAPSLLRSVNQVKVELMDRVLVAELCVRSHAMQDLFDLLASPTQLRGGCHCVVRQVQTMSGRPKLCQAGPNYQATVFCELIVCAASRWLPSQVLNLKICMPLSAGSLLHPSRSIFSLSLRMCVLCVCVCVLCVCVVCVSMFRSAASLHGIVCLQARGWANANASATI